MDIQKEFKKYMSDKYGARATEMDIIGWKVYEDAFQAGAMLMADRVKELELTCGVRGYDGLLKQLKEYEQQAKDSEGKDNIIIAELRQQLNEALEIIKTISKNANHYDKIDLENKAKQFLPILDKLKEK